MKCKFNKTVFAGILGNILECYDFTIYAFLSPVISVIFFPTNNSLISLLLTLSVFAVSFLVRPLGAILFGYLGDHLGRKRTLMISIICMSTATFLTGLLPSYAAIGIGAPILLLLLRLVQGMSVSGEMTTAMSYLIEHAHHQQRGFVGSLAMCSSCGGGALASIIAALFTILLTQEAMLNWGWRLPFLLGGVFGFISVLVRLKFQFHETSLFQAAITKSKIPRPTIFKHYKQLHYKPIFKAVLLTCIMAMGYYCFMAYFNVFLIQSLGQPVQSVLLIGFICQLLLTISIPLLGYISDLIGRKPVLLSGISLLLLLIHPIFWLLQQPKIILVFLGELLFIFSLAPIIATIPTTLAEMFQVHTRNSGISLSYNISQAIFGGTAPFIGIALINKTQNLYAPAWYLFAGAFISLFALISLNETYQQPLK